MFSPLFRPTTAFPLASLTLALLAAPPGRADYPVDVRTSVSASVASFATRLFLDAARTPAPAGTRIWFVVDVNGDGVPANPQAGAILGVDDRLVLEDVIAGSLPPATSAGRFNRSGFIVKEDSLQTQTNVYVYLWQYNRPLSEVPHYEPSNGAKFGVDKVAATPKPEFGNATWRVVTDVLADSRTVGGGGGPVAPSITTQPLSQTVDAGSPVTFSVEATGTPPLTYQWRKEGVDVTGASGSAYSIPSAAESDEGAYTVLVSNSEGSKLSDPATLTVTTPVLKPSIVTQPLSQTVDVGTAVTLSVVATGTSPLAYQWRKEGADLPGQTAATLQIASAQPADQGRYTVNVSNAGGETLSDDAVLTVRASIQAPRIVDPVFARVGDTHVFSFSFATQAGRTYQVQSSPTLSGNPVPWTNQGSAIAGTGETVRFDHPVGSGTAVPSSGFYRVAVQ